MCFHPSPKSSQKDPAASESYRSIAGSSLILQVFEQCIVLIWGDSLQSDSLQLGFKKKCSTGTATWLVNEVLQHYLRQGSKPIAVVLDCTKAFDKAKFSILFGRLLEKIPAVVVRILSYSYREQLAWIRWGRGCTSGTFEIKNGTRQGSVPSPTFWNIYLNPLIEELRRKGIGCHLAGKFVGVVAYADDLILLAPNRSAAQIMLSICEEFAEKNNIKFSSHVNPSLSKSKAMFVNGMKNHDSRPVPLVLCDRPLPWVDQCDHLGHKLTTAASMTTDCRIKRADFIDKSVKTREFFDFAHPMEVITANQKYNDSHYGHQLWDLPNQSAGVTFASWRTNIKLAWSLPRNTKSYFIDHLLAQQVVSPRVSLLCCFHNFFHQLLESDSDEVRIISRIAAWDIINKFYISKRLNCNF